jgi:hypothetical protein
VSEGQWFAKAVTPGLVKVASTVAGRAVASIWSVPPVDVASVIESALRDTFRARTLAELKGDMAEWEKQFQGVADQYARNSGISTSGPVETASVGTRCRGGERERCGD